MMIGIWGKRPELQPALAAAVAEGLSASMIAARLSRQFNVSITRNAVIGRATRTGLQFALSPRGENVLERADRIKRVELRRHAKFLIRRVKAAKADFTKVPEPEPKGDIDTGCRWPHGEASERNFCGAARHEGSSWCPHHYGRVFSSTKPMAEAA